MDNPTWRNGRDKRVPPKSGPDKRMPAKVADTQPPFYPPARGGAMQSPSPCAGRDGEGLDPRRGTLVVPVEAARIIQRGAADSEGHACHARRRGKDWSRLCAGADKQAPPSKHEKRAISRGALSMSLAHTLWSSRVAADLHLRDAQRSRRRRKKRPRGNLSTACAH